MKKLDNYDSSNHYTALPISYENLNHSCHLTTENFYSENAFYGACSLRAQGSHAVITIHGAACDPEL